MVDRDVPLPMQSRLPSCRCRCNHSWLPTQRAVGSRGQQRPLSKYKFVFSKIIQIGVRVYHYLLITLLGCIWFPTEALDCNRPTALSKGVSMSVMSESGHSTPAGNTFKFGDRLVVTCPPSSSLGIICISRIWIDLNEIDRWRVSSVAVVRSSSASGQQRCVDLSGGRSMAGSSSHLWTGHLVRFSLP